MDVPQATGHSHDAEESAQLLARTIAHLAAQLTMTQIRLRALASEIEELGLIDRERVARRAGEVARSETGTYLRENLGEALTEVVDVESLELEIVAFLQPSPKP
jgi:hypothetical protein